MQKYKRKILLKTYGRGKATGMSLAERLEEDKRLNSACRAGVGKVQRKHLFGPEQFLFPETLHPLRAPFMAYAENCGSLTQLRFPLKLGSFYQLFNKTK